MQQVSARGFGENETKQKMKSNFIFSYLLTTWKEIFVIYRYGSEKECLRSQMSKCCACHHIIYENNTKQENNVVSTEVFVSRNNRFIKINHNIQGTGPHRLKPRNLTLISSALQSMKQELARKQRAGFIDL